MKSEGDTEVGRRSEEEGESEGGWIGGREGAREGGGERPRTGVVVLEK